MILTQVKVFHPIPKLRHPSILVIPKFITIFTNFNTNFEVEFATLSNHKIKNFCARNKELNSPGGGSPVSVTTIISNLVERVYFHQVLVKPV
jgi:hypothetical protein